MKDIAAQASLEQHMRNRNLPNFLLFLLIVQFFLSRSWQVNPCIARKVYNSKAPSLSIFNQTFAGIFLRKVIRHVLDGRVEICLGRLHAGHLLTVEVWCGVTECHLNRVFLPRISYKVAVVDRANDFIVVLKRNYFEEEIL